MKQNTTKSAYILIDMENGFISPDSPFCISGAAATVPACRRTMAAARARSIPVFIVRREYRHDGSDVELTRFRKWAAAGRAMSPEAPPHADSAAPEGLAAVDGDYSIVKPRWSAFFGTELDLILRRLGVRTVILAGTTTPNCIRTTCYDANALDYNVVILEDCCSSQNEEIQRSNIEDMRRIGAVIMDADSFEDYDDDTVPDEAEYIRAALQTAKDRVE